jgi:hypothetical protein
VAIKSFIKKYRQVILQQNKAVILQPLSGDCFFEIFDAKVTIFASNYLNKCTLQKVRSESKFQSKKD